jgi:cell division protein FtsL
VNNLPRQLRIVIGRKLFGSSGLPLFLYIGFILPTSQMSGITPELKIALNIFS